MVRGGARHGGEFTGPGGAAPADAAAPPPPPSPLITPSFCTPPAAASLATDTVLEYDDGFRLVRRRRRWCWRWRCHSLLCSVLFWLASPLPLAPGPHRRAPAAALACAHPVCVHHPPAPPKQVVDAKSLLYLFGMRLDHSSALIGGGFKFCERPPSRRARPAPPCRRLSQHAVPSGRPPALLRSPPHPLPPRPSCPAVNPNATDSCGCGSSFGV